MSCSSPKLLFFRQKKIVFFHFSLGSEGVRSSDLGSNPISWNLIWILGNLTWIFKISVDFPRKTTIFDRNWAKIDYASHCYLGLFSTETIPKLIRVLTDIKTALWNQFVWVSKRVRMHIFILRKYFFERVGEEHDIAL